MELCIDRLTKQYGRRLAVDRLDLELHQGVYGLLGANGAGKTTLMRMLCDILTPTSGEIRYNGQEIGALGEDYRSRLGYLPQDFGYYPEFTAEKFLLYLAALKGLGRIQAGLDPKERVRFRNLISACAKDRIVLLSTHIVSDVEYIAGEILVMKEGRLIHRGAPEVITHEIDGKVWECEVDTERADELCGRYNVGNLKNTGDKTILRIVGEEKPMEGAVSVAPTLEDLYLYYFQEEER